MTVKNLLLFLPIFYISAAFRAQTDTVAAKINKIPFKHVDALAKFTQGDFKTYISQNLQYNRRIENNIKGQIVLLVGIGADGNISHVSVLKSLSPVIDQEVVRVINSSPKWQPAVLNNQKVSMDMVFNIDIGINGSKPQPQIVAKTPVSTSVLTTNKVVPVTPVKKTALIETENAALPVKKPNFAVIKPVDKKVIPAVIKTVTPPAVKKPDPPIVKKVIPPIVKKAEPVMAKKVITPAVKKPDPPIVKKVTPPIVKKVEPAMAKKVITLAVNKLNPPIVKKQAQPLVKKSEPPIVKKEAKKKKKVISSQNIFNPESSDPIFPGGPKEFSKYLSANITYPPNSKKANIQGRVSLSFVVEEDGSVNDVEIISSPAEDLSQEAIRVLLACPKWKPATQNKRRVPFRYTILPINFTLADKNN